MPVGGGSIEAVIHPKHGNLRLRLGGEMENRGFVGSEVGRDDGPPIRMGNGPAGDFKRGLGAQLGVPLGNLIGCHIKIIGFVHSKGSVRSNRRSFPR